MDKLVIVTENPKAKRHSYASFSCGSPRWFVSLIEFLLNRLIRLSMLKYLCLGFSNDHFQDDTRLLRGILPWPFPLVSTNLTLTFLQTSPLGKIGMWCWVETGWSRTPSSVVNVENEMKRSNWMSLREALGVSPVRERVVLDGWGLDSVIILFRYHLLWIKARDNWDKI